MGRDMIKVMSKVPGLLLLFYAATPAIAEEGHINLGLGFYSISTKVVSSARSDRYTGSALIAGYSFNDLFAVNTHYYALSHDKFTATKMDGFDFTLRLGYQGKGFIYFAGLGYYQETLTQPALGTSDITGGLFGYGLGYNWEHVSLQLEGAVRGTDDYAKFSNVNSTDVAAENYSLNLLYRF